MRRICEKQHGLLRLQMPSPVNKRASGCTHTPLLPVCVYHTEKTEYLGLAALGDFALGVADAVHLLCLIAHDQNRLPIHLCQAGARRVRPSRIFWVASSAGLLDRLFMKKKITIRASRSSTSSKSKMVGSRRRPLLSRSLITAPNMAVDLYAFVAR